MARQMMPAAHESHQTLRLEAKGAPDIAARFRDDEQKPSHHTFGEMHDSFKAAVVISQAMEGRSGLPCPANLATHPLQQRGRDQG